MNRPLEGGTGAFIDDLEVIDVVDGLVRLGDGSEGACPCGNESAPSDSAGCVNSLGTGGALRMEGQASLSADTLKLRGSGMPNQPVVYFPAAVNHPAAPFGDGLRCTAGFNLTNALTVVWPPRVTPPSTRSSPR